MGTKARIAAGVAAAAAALTIVVAPAAQAATVAQTCTAQGDATLCQSDGNAQISATPPAVDYQAQYPFFGIGGYGLDFHHDGRR